MFSFSTVDVTDSPKPLQRILPSKTYSQCIRSASNLYERNQHRKPVFQNRISARNKEKTWTQNEGGKRKRPRAILAQQSAFECKMDERNETGWPERGTSLVQRYHNELDRAQFALNNLIREKFPELESRNDEFTIMGPETGRARAQKKKN